jgi:hypothetical protein
MRLSSRSCSSSAFIPASTSVKPSVAPMACFAIDFLVAAEAGVGDGDEGGVVGARCEGPFDRGLGTALVGGPPHHDTLVLIDHIDPTKATAPPPSRDEPPGTSRRLVPALQPVLANGYTAILPGVASATADLHKSRTTGSTVGPTGVWAGEGQRTQPTRPSPRLGRIRDLLPWIFSNRDGADMVLDPARGREGARRAPSPRAWHDAWG